MTAPGHAPRELPIEVSTPVGACPLASILCTEELRSRPSRPAEFEQENSALAALIRALADSPRTILQTLADKVLEVLHADSAGLSLLAKDETRFYWPAVAGAWERHIGGGTPRNFGPCGDVLDRNIPMLFTHWERRYPYLSSATPFAEEGLLAPFFVNGKAVGTIWAITHDKARKFDAEDLRLLESMGRFASAAYQAVESIENLKLEIAARERGEAEVRELARGLEAKIRRLVEANVVGIIMWNLEGVITEANGAFLRMVQYDREDLTIGRVRWTGLTPVEWRSHDEQAIAGLKSSGVFQPFEKEYFRKDGSRVPVLLGGALFEGSGNEGVAFVLDLTERKKMEQALRHSEELYRVVVETANEAVISIDEAGRILFGNGATTAIFGYSAAELVGQPLTMLIAESFRPPHCHAITWYLTTGQRNFDWHSVEAIGRRKNGEEFPVEVSLGEVVKYDQRIFTGCIRDITERKKAEAVQTAQAQQASVRADVSAAFSKASALRTTLNSSAEAIVRHLGAAFARIWTLDESENTLVLQASAGLYTRLDGTYARVPVGQLKIGHIAQEGKAHLTNDVPNDERVIDRDWAKRESMIAFAGYPLFVEGRVIGVLAMFARHALDKAVLDAMESVADIIAQGIYRKEAEDKLRQREHSLRLLTETIPQMIWSATASGGIDYCNRQILDYTGRGEDQLRGEGWAEVIHPDDLPGMRESWRRAVENQLPFEVEFRHRRADGMFRWCLSRAQPLRDEQGRVLRWYGSMTDLDDWKHAQETARRTQAELAHVTRVMTMGELASSIAHEINQPLGAIVNYGNACVRLLSGGPENIEEVKRAISKIIGDANRASAIIAHIRALSKKSQLEKVRLNVKELIDEVMALARHELSARLISVRVHCAENLPPILGDRIQIQQVLLNLVMNGVESMSAVTAKDRTLTVRAGLHEADSQHGVLVRIQDAGVGLRQADKSRLFEAFYTTKPNGLGMGLAISRSIAEAHGGKLWAEPNDGPGATFCFELPVELPNEP